MEGSNAGSLPRKFGIFFSKVSMGVYTAYSLWLPGQPHPFMQEFQVP